jgi:uncharacterized membrane protein YoaK (UPF0700 family)
MTPPIRVEDLEPRPPYYKQLTAAALGLAAIAGFINALTVAGALHIGTTHMTGLTTRLSVDVVHDAARATIALDLGLLASFVLGAAISGAILDSTQFRLGRRYGVLLLIEAAVLTTSWLASGAGAPLALTLAPLAAAAGLQNSMATQYSRAIVRTTHVTGVLTDLGIAIGKWVARRGVMKWRVVLYLAIFAGFAAGGVGGALAVDAWGGHALLVPIAVTGVGGATYYVARLRWLRRRGRGQAESDTAQ